MLLASLVPSSVLSILPMLNVALVFPFVIVACAKVHFPHCPPGARIIESSGTDTIASSPPYTTRLPPNLLSKLLSNAPHTGNETLMATSATSRTTASLSKAACTAYADAAWVWHMQQKRLGLDPILQRAHTESQNSVTVIVEGPLFKCATGARNDIERVLSTIYRKLIVGKQATRAVIAGDQQTFNPAIPDRPPY